MKFFYELLGNTILCSVTNYTVWFAIIFFVYLQTTSVFATSIMSGIYLVSVALTGFWFGSLVDHSKKKTIMIASSAVSLACYSIGFLVYITANPNVFTQTSSLTLWTLIPILLAGVVAGNIRTIALPTVITFLVPEKNRDKANGLVGTASGVAFMVVSVISGILVGHSGMYHVLLLSILISILSITHLWFVPIEENEIVRASNQSSTLDIKGTIKVIGSISGLFPLIIFSMINNFLGGVFMSLMDAYGLSLVSVQVWGIIWGVLSSAFIIGGLAIAKWGLGKNPVRSLFFANLVIWTVSCFFTIYPSIVLLAVGMFMYLCVVPFIEASEHTIIQKLVPPERQGRVFGFAQSVELSASPLTAFAIGPIAQFIFIPFMTTGAGVSLIGDWFGTGSSRGIALVFTLTGVIGLSLTLLAMRSRYYKLLATQYVKK